MARKRSARPTQPGNYAVGYCHPPVHTRFKPGQSGHPVGRPRGTKSLSAIMEKELNEKVTVTEGGRRRKISKAEAAIKQLVNIAAGGDHRAIRLLHEITRASSTGAGSTVPAAVATPSALPPERTPIDFNKMTTSQLTTIYEAFLLLEGSDKAPPPLMPPGDPEEAPS